jgi:hypothetical protein
MENSPMLWLRMLPQPGMADHKHSRGHLKVLSGGISSTGAARLAVRAGLRIGSGLATLLTPPSALMVNASTANGCDGEARRRRRRALRGDPDGVGCDCRAGGWALRLRRGRMSKRS